MKYIAELSQPNGCDYTIECGTKVIQLPGETWEQALESLKLEIAENYTSLERQVSNVTMYEITRKSDIDLIFIYREINERQLRADAQIHETIERHQLAELQRKYGKQ